MNDKIITLLHDNFLNIHGEISRNELNDRLYIEIQNDKKLLSLCDRRTPCDIWQAIQKAVVNLVLGILEYNEMPTNGVNFNQVKKAIKEIFNADFYEIAQPTFNYYYKERF